MEFRVYYVTFDKSLQHGLPTFFGTVENGGTTTTATTTVVVIYIVDDPINVEENDVCVMISTK